jgi:hypothetical protein
VFASWAQPGNKIIYTFSGNAIEAIGTRNPQWRLNGARVYRIQSQPKVPFNAYPFPSVVYEISLARKPHFILVNAIAPSFIINFMTLILYLFPFGQQMGIGKMRKLF